MISAVGADPDSRVFFSKDNPHLQALETLENTYTKDDNVMFALAPRDGQVFTRDTLAAIKALTDAVGNRGYAFVDVRPRVRRNREARTIDVTFTIQEGPRVYVERIDISGNTNTRDKVIRREFRLAEGDPFNSVRVSRSRDRIQSLGFFQENLEITQEQGSAPDRVVLGVAVEERATGELQFSAGFSSLERFLVNLSIRQRNFRGLGQELEQVVHERYMWSDLYKCQDIHRRTVEGRLRGRAAPNPQKRRKISGRSAAPFGASGEAQSQRALP